MSRNPREPFGRISSPFDQPAGAPTGLRGADGMLSAADEVEHHRRAAAADWIAHHDLSGTVTVNALLERTDEAGSDVATAEALAGTLPNRADGGSWPGVGRRG